MSTAHIQNQENGGAASQFWEPRRTLTLDAARRHSSFVKLARRILVGLSGLLVAVLLWYFVSAPKSTASPDNPEETVKMVNPIYKGRTGDGLPYRITANDAVRLVGNPDEVNLSNPVLNFFRGEGAGKSVVLSAVGVFNSKDQILELKEDVDLKTDDGYNCQTAHARVFVKGKRIEGDKEILCTGNFGRASGHAYEINDSYTEFVFKNGMTARLNPKQASEVFVPAEELRGPQETPKPKAQDTPIVSFAGDQPIDIIAQRASYKGPKTILTGEVDVRQDTSKILSDRMDLYREKIRVDESGNVKYGNVNTIVAVGDFSYETPKNRVTGDKGVYERDKNIITVTGNVVFTQGASNSVTGEKLTYDLTTNRAKFGGKCVGKSCKTTERVEIEFKPPAEGQ